MYRQRREYGINADKQTFSIVLRGIRNLGSERQPALLKEVMRDMREAGELPTLPTPTPVPYDASACVFVDDGTGTVFKEVEIDVDKLTELVAEFIKQEDEDYDVKEEDIVIDNIRDADAGSEHFDRLLEETELLKRQLHIQRQQHIRIQDMVEAVQQNLQEMKEFLQEHDEGDACDHGWDAPDLVLEHLREMSALEEYCNDPEVHHLIFEVEQHGFKAISGYISNPKLMAFVAKFLEYHHMKLKGST